MFYYSIPLFIVLLWSSFLTWVIWKGNRPGERLWNTCMGLMILGPIPFATMIFHDMGVINIHATMTPFQQSMFWTGFFLYIIIPAIIGDVFRL